MPDSLRFVLLGHPVGHSLSPVIHQAAYLKHGLPHRYELVDCPDPQAVAAQIEALRRGSIAGANVTVPWKRVALQLADAADPSARETGAANVLLRDKDGRVVAFNTDAPALARLLLAGSTNTDARCALVLGNGGASLAAVVAAKAVGFGAVWVSARRWGAPLAGGERQEEFAALGAKPLPWSAKEWSTIVPSLGAIVQATSAGMLGASGGEELAAMVPWTELAPEVFAYDVVYNPTTTPFLRRAQQAGLPNEGGLSMLVGQAALALELWLGIEAPIEAMTQSARSALFGSAGSAPVGPSGSQGSEA